MFSVIIHPVSTVSISPSSLNLWPPKFLVETLETDDSRWARNSPDIITLKGKFKIRLTTCREAPRREAEAQLYYLFTLDAVNPTPRPLCL